MHRRLWFNPGNMVCCNKYECVLTINPSQIPVWSYCEVNYLDEIKLFLLLSHENEEVAATANPYKLTDRDKYYSCFINTEAGERDKQKIRISFGRQHLKRNICETLINTTLPYQNMHTDFPLVNDTFDESLNTALT